MSFYVIQAQDGRYWHGYDKDSGATWGVPGEAALFEAAGTARRALSGLSCPSAEDAVVVTAPPAALMGGAPTDATDGELEAASPTSGKRLRLKLRRSER